MVFHLFEIEIHDILCTGWSYLSAKGSGAESAEVGGRSRSQMQNQREMQSRVNVSTTTTIARSNISPK